jgi:hypothetical protein
MYARFSERPISYDKVFANPSLILDDSIEICGILGYTQVVNMLKSLTYKGQVPSVSELWLLQKSIKTSQSPH